MSEVNISGVNQSVESIFLNYAVTKLDSLCERIVTCVSKLTPEQIWMRGTEHQNAVGNLALHLNGDPLPGAKMPCVALRRRGGGQIEKVL